MSNSIQALRERLAALNKKMNHLLAEKGSQTWSVDDQATFDGDGAEAERVERQIAASKKMIEQDREDNFTDAPRTVPGTKAAALDGFDIFLRKGRHGLSAEESLKVRNVMSTTTTTEGGFSVMPLVATELIDLLKAYGYMRKVASQITTSNGADLSYPTSDGTSEVGEWVAQNVTATAADPVFGSRALNTFKAGSKVVAVPIELLQDSQIDITAMVLTRLRDRIGRLANLGYTVGTGTGQPNGIVTAATVGKVGLAGQTLTVIYDDLVDMVDSLDAAYLETPVVDPQMAGAAPGWMFAQTTRRVIRKIKDSAGRPIWTPSYDEGLSSSTPDRLLGYPVYLNNDMAVPAANAKSIAFGNFQKYFIRDAMDVTLFRFEDSVYMTKGQIAFLAWTRTGGNLMDINSVKVYQHSAT